MKVGGKKPRGRPRLRTECGDNTSSIQSSHRTEKPGERQSWRSTPDRDKIGKSEHGEQVIKENIQCKLKLRQEHVNTGNIRRDIYSTRSPKYVNDRIHDSYKYIHIFVHNSRSALVTDKTHGTHPKPAPVITS